METVVPLRFVLVALAVVVSLAVVVGVAVWQTSDAGDADPETSHATVFIVKPFVFSYIHMFCICTEWEDTREVWAG